MLKHFNYLFLALLFVEVFKSARSSCQAVKSCFFSAIVVSRNIYALPAWGGFLSNDLVAKLDAFFKKAFRWGYSCDLRRLSVLLQEADEHLFIKCFITRITVFTSYYLWKRFYPWNSGPRIVFWLCLSVTLTCTNVRLYCDICLVMHIRFCM